MNNDLRLAFIVPIKDKRAVAETCLRSLVAAVDASAGNSLIVVDHSSSDGTDEIARRVLGGHHQVLQVSGGYVGAVRNLGAASSPGDWLVFVDGDCVVPHDFANRLRTVIASTTAAAVGCEVGLPASPNWIERAWDAVTRHVVEGEARWINSACFAVTREAFDQIGGFDESRTSSEDVDICLRLKSAGFVLWQFRALEIEHHGNPQSLQDFYRRLRWHGEGAIESDGRLQKSMMIWLVFTHAALLLLAFFAAAMLLVRLTLAAGLVLITAPWIAPSVLWARAAVGYRRLPNPITTLPLLQVALVARIHGFLRAWKRVSA